MSLSAVGSVAAAASSSQRGVTTTAICSGKGGVGKTNVSVNLSIALAKLGREVMLMDADLAMANADILLGVSPAGTLAEVIDGQRFLGEILLRSAEGVHLVPAASGVSRLTRLSPAEHAGLINAFGTLSMPLDDLVVDIAAGIGESVTMFARAVQRIIVVVCDEPTSMMDAYALIKVLATEHRVSEFHILTNMVEDEQQGMRLFRNLTRVSEQYLDVRLNMLGYIPRDRFVQRAVQQRRPVLSLYPGAPASKAFDRIARRLLALRSMQETQGGLGFFIERTLAGGEDVA